MNMKWKQNDGGRVQAGFEPTNGACVYRAIAIATGIPYKQVYEQLSLLNKISNPNSVGNGVSFDVLDKYMFSIGWKWKELRKPIEPFSELMPKKTVVALATDHLVACIDGIFHDTYDFTEGKNRRIEGYYEKVV